MTKNTKEETRLYLETFLPDAVGDILESYQNFLADKNEEGHKEFLEFHKACKAAITNIEQLLKLYKWIEDNNEKIPCQEDINLMISDSRVRLNDSGND